MVKIYDFGPHDIERLRLCCEALDRYEGARAVLEEKGLAYLDRHGQPKPRPEVAVERDSRLAFFRALRELDLKDVPDPPRLPRGQTYDRSDNDAERRTAQPARWTLD